MESGDKQAVNQHLALFKERGVVQFDKVLSIPNDERIPALIQQPEGRLRVSTALSASIMSAFGNLNLRIGMNEDQVCDLAEEIIDESSQDNLGLEDVLLFLKDLITGKAGKIYDRMDIQIFFELFENYRQDRHTSLQNIRYEQDQQHKALPVNDRLSDLFQEDERSIMHNAMNQHLKEEWKEGKK